MANQNLEINKKYFENLPDEVGAQPKLIYKTQLSVGDTVRFSYGAYHYTGVIASTPRAPFGQYTARNTRNRLVTMFIFSSPTFNLPMDKVVTFVGEVYDKNRLEKSKKTRYIPQRQVRSKFRWDRFWSVLKRLFRMDSDIPTLDSRNFRTFILNKIGNVQRLKP